MATEWAQGKEPPPDTLPYSEARQNATLGHAMRNERFYMQIKDRVKPGWFLSPYNQKLWEAVQAWQEKYGRRPTAQELHDAPSVRLEDIETKTRLQKTLATCIEATTEYLLDAIERDLTEWLQARIYFKAMTDSARLYNSQKLADAIRTIRDAGKEASDTRFYEDGEYNFANIIEHLAANERELHGAVSTGLSILDRVLCPQATSGALLKGDVTLFLAPSNTGKTRCLATVVRNNALDLGKHVLYITHEGRPRQIEEMLLTASMSDPASDRWITTSHLYKLYMHQAGQRVLGEHAARIAQNIMYLPLNRAGQTVEEVAATIRRKQDEWAARHGGRGFDLIVNDYPSKLTTEKAKGGQLQKRHIDDMVSDHFVQLALELDVPIVGAFQTNREGSKAMKGRGDQKRLLDIEDSNEAFAPMQNVANVISINRDATCKENSTMILHVCKSRTGDTGWAVVCNTRFGSCVTHHDALGATAYRGSASRSEVAKDLLAQFNGKTVPDNALPPE